MLLVHSFSHLYCLRVKIAKELMSSAAIVVGRREAWFYILMKIRVSHSRLTVGQGHLAGENCVIFKNNFI